MRSSLITTDDAVCTVDYFLVRSPLRSRKNVGSMWWKEYLFASEVLFEADLLLLMTEVDPAFDDFQLLLLLLQQHIDTVRQLSLLSQRIVQRTTYHVLRRTATTQHLPNF